jgi:hypothetical protein
MSPKNQSYGNQHEVTCCLALCSLRREAAAEKHMAQLQHNMWVSNATRAVLSVITGGGKWVEITISLPARGGHHRGLRCPNCARTRARPSAGVPVVAYGRAASIETALYRMRAHASSDRGSGRLRRSSPAASSQKILMTDCKSQSQTALDPRD